MGREYMYKISTFYLNDKYLFVIFEILHKSAIFWQYLGKMSILALFLNIESSNFFCFKKDTLRFIVSNFEDSILLKYLSSHALTKKTDKI
jgi:hypothetical protein